MIGGKLNEIVNIGLDLNNVFHDPSNIPEITNKLSTFDSIFMDLYATNDFLIADWVENSFPNSQLIFTIQNPRDGIEELVEFKADMFGKKEVGVLFDLSSFENPLEMPLFYTERVTTLGARNPKSIEQLELFKENYRRLDYIGLDLSPLNFYYDVIKWAEQNNIPIIGFNVMGGYQNSARMISTFSVPYLLLFSAKYCSTVVTSGRSLFQALENKQFLEQLIGMSCNLPEIEENKNTFKLPPPATKLVYTSMKLGGDSFVLDYNFPSFLISPDSLSISLFSGNNILPQDERCKEVDMIELEANFNELDGLGFKKEDLLGYIAYAKLRLFKALSKIYSSEAGYKFSFSRLTESAFLVHILSPIKHTGFLRKPIEGERFSLIVSIPAVGNIFIKKISE